MYTVTSLHDMAGSNSELYSHSEIQYESVLRPVSDTFSLYLSFAIELSCCKYSLHIVKNLNHTASHGAFCVAFCQPRS